MPDQIAFLLPAPRMPLVAQCCTSCMASSCTYSDAMLWVVQVVIEEIPAEADPVDAAVQKRKADSAAMERPQSSSKKQKKQAEQRQAQDAAAAEAALAAGNGAQPGASGQGVTKAEKAAQKAATEAVDKAAAAAEPAGAKGSKGKTPSR